MPTATPRRLRSAVLFALGSVGFLYELVIDKLDRPTILILITAMLGLPTLLAVDERRRRNGETSPKGDDEP
jgi:hypothetical protein